jgi:hypothetical protein
VPEPGSTDCIDASWNFQFGLGGEFLCDFLTGLIDTLVTIEPEFTVGEVEPGQEIGAVCKNAMDHA